VRGMANYANGTPSWIDLGSPDPDASAKYYGDLFGWTTTEPGPVEETGGYRMFQKDGKNVAGLGPAQDPNAVYWTTYLAVDDADKTAELVGANGGMVIVPPMDVMDAGRMAIFADPTGAAFGVWQAGEHKGAEVKNEANSLVWNELITNDVERAKEFYNAAFGITNEPFPMGDAPPYTVLQVNGEGVGGILPADQMPEGTPSHWLPYIEVADTDATVAKAESLGGSAMAPPFDVPTVGRIAVLAGPHGEFIALLKPEPQAS
jgi:uncharacterized protein